MVAEPPKKGAVPNVGEARKTRCRCTFCGVTVSNESVIEYASDCYGNVLNYKSAHFICWVKSEFFNPPQLTAEEWEQIMRDKFSRKV